jgi:hypothetical protein
VTVTDALGATATSAVFTSDNTNIPPAPLTAAVVNVSRQGTRTAYTFDYTVALTGGTGPYTYDWDFDTANPGTDVQTTNAGVVVGKVFAARRIFSGTVTVTDALGDSVTSPAFASDNLIDPQIAAVAPARASVGETVELQGSGFGNQDGTDKVTLGGVDCAVDAAAGGWSDASIFVIIPLGAANGDFVVHTELDSNGFPFKVIPAAPGGPGGGQF